MSEIRQNEIEEQINSDGMKKPNFHGKIPFLKAMVSSSQHTPSQRELLEADSLKLSMSPFDLEEQGLEVKSEEVREFNAQRREKILEGKLSGIKIPEEKFDFDLSLSPEINRKKKADVAFNGNSELSYFTPTAREGSDTQYQRNIADEDRLGYLLF